MAKARKWSNLKGALPAPDPGPSEWYTKVLAAKDERITKIMPELAAEWRALEDEEAVALVAQKARNIKYAALELRILEELEKVEAASGQDAWRGDGSLFTPQYTPRPVIEDPAVLMAWVKKTKLEGLLTLPPARLNEILKEALDPKIVETLTPGQRALLAKTPGMPGSGAPPPGVKAFLQVSVHHTGPRKATPTDADVVKALHGDGEPR